MTTCPACAADHHDDCTTPTCGCAAEHRWRAIRDTEAPPHPHGGVRRLAPAA